TMQDPGGHLPTEDAAHREATAEEAAQILQQVEKGLDEGALAVGLAINYTPAATRTAGLDIFRLAAKHGAPGHAHLRFMGDKEPDTALAALEELIAASAITGAPLHVVHVTSVGLRQTPLLLASIEGARKRGVDVTTECYPYDAGSTSLESAL